MWSMGGLSVDVGPSVDELETLWVQASVEYERATGEVRVLRFVDGDYRAVAVFSDAEVQLTSGASAATVSSWLATNESGERVTVVARVPGARCCGA